MAMSSNVTYAQTLTKYAQQKQHEIAERKRMEKANYEKACQIGTLDAYNEYLSMYPKGLFVKDVKSRITTLEEVAEQSCFEVACRRQSSQALQDYIDRYPNGHFVQDAKECIESEFFSNLYLKFLRHRFGLGRAATFGGDGLFL